MELLTYAILFFIFIFTRFVGVLVGGGSLIDSPLLILLGIPPHVAIATKKGSGIGASIVSIYKFRKNIDVKLGLILTPIFVTPMIIAAYIFLKIPEKYIMRGVAILVLLLIPIIMKKNWGIKNQKRSKHRKSKGYISMALMGFYSGFYSPCAALFRKLILIKYFGKDFKGAIATNLIPGFFQTIILFFIFLVNGKINFIIFFLMLFGFMIGAYLAGLYAEKKGNKGIKFVFITMSIISAIILIIKSFS